jgi:hypothetical protein
MLLGIFKEKEKVLTTGLSPSLVQDSAASSHLLFLLFPAFIKKKAEIF